MKIDLDSTSVLVSVFHRFWTDFGSILVPRTLPRRCVGDRPIGVGASFEGSPSPTSILSVATSFWKRFERILDRFWNDFLSIFGFKIDANNSAKLFWKRFLIDFKSKWEPLWGKITPQTSPSTNQPNKQTRKQSIKQLTNQSTNQPIYTSTWPGGMREAIKSAAPSGQRAQDLVVIALQCRVSTGSAHSALPPFCSQKWPPKSNFFSINFQRLF